MSFSRALARDIRTGFTEKVFTNTVGKPDRNRAILEDCAGGSVDGYRAGSKQQYTVFSSSR